MNQKPPADNDTKASIHPRQMPAHGPAHGQNGLGPIHPSAPPVAAGAVYPRNCPGRGDHVFGNGFFQRVQRQPDLSSPAVQCRPGGHPSQQTEHDDEPDPGPGPFVPEPVTAGSCRGGAGLRRQSPASGSPDRGGSHRGGHGLSGAKPAPDPGRVGAAGQGLEKTPVRALRRPFPADPGRDTARHDGPSVGYCLFGGRNRGLRGQFLQKTAISS